MLRFGHSWSKVLCNFLLLVSHYLQVLNNFWKAWKPAVTHSEKKVFVLFIYKSAKGQFTGSAKHFARRCIHSAIISVRLLKDAEVIVGKYINQNHLRVFPRLLLMVLKTKCCIRSEVLILWGFAVLTVGVHYISVQWKMCPFYRKNLYWAQMTKELSCGEKPA